MRRLPLVLSIAAISVAGARTASAQSAEAEALFNEGDAKMKAGKLDEACQAFEASNRIEPRAGTLIRLGECREQNHQLASAWSAYKDALTRVKDPNKKVIATGRVSDLEPRMSSLTISVPEASRLPGLALARNGELVDPALWNRKLPINGGQYIIVVRAPNRVEWTKTVEVKVEKDDVTVEIPVLADPTQVVKPPPPPPTTTTGPGTIEPVDDKGPVSMFTTKRKLAVGAAAVAGVSLGVGIVLGSQAKSKRNQAHSLCPDPMVACTSADEATALSAAASDRALFANVMFGVAGAAAIGAAVLWITGAPPDEPPPVAVIPTPTSLTVIAHF